MSPLPDPVGLAATVPSLRILREHWGWFSAEGILLLLLGCAAIVVPVMAGLGVTIFLGWLFLIAGIAGLVATLKARQAPGFWWSLLSALLAASVGGLLLWHPMEGLVGLTYVLILFFLADGLLMIILGLSHRSFLSRSWGWLIANGVLDLVLGIILIAGLPATLLWALGLLVGIDLIFGGSSLLFLALEARRLPDR